MEALGGDCPRTKTYGCGASGGCAATRNARTNLSNCLKTNGHIGKRTLTLTLGRTDVLTSRRAIYANLSSSSKPAWQQVVKRRKTPQHCRSQVPPNEGMALFPAELLPRLLSPPTCHDHDARLFLLPARERNCVAQRHRARQNGGGGVGARVSKWHARGKMRHKVPLWCFSGHEVKEGSYWCGMHWQQ